MSLRGERVENNREGGGGGGNSFKFPAFREDKQVFRCGQIYRELSFDDPALMPFPVSTKVARQILFTDFYTLYPVP